MQIIDLSHVINQDTTMYPGTEKPVLELINVDGYIETKITMYSHTGTHMDAPLHILKNGKSLDNLPISKFYGSSIKIDCKNLPDSTITLDFLEPFKNKIAKAEFLLFNSGWSLKWKSDTYFEGFPTLSPEGAEWLTHFKLKGIGLDSISLDKVSSMALPNHHTVLSKEILIIENLTNLDALPDTPFIFQCFPLKTENADGSPVRAVAIID